MKFHLYVAVIVTAAMFSDCTSIPSEVQTLQQEAEHGNATAMFDLGCKYYYGEDTPQDYAAAAKWYRQAAERGNLDAMYNLGGMYRYGRGVTVDYTEAGKWYRMAAAKGDPNAAGQLKQLEVKLRR